MKAFYSRIVLLSLLASQEIHDVAGNLACSGDEEVESNGCRYFGVSGNCVLTVTNCTSGIFFLDAIMDNGIVKVPEHIALVEGISGLYGSGCIETANEYTVVNVKLHDDARIEIGGTCRKGGDKLWLLSLLILPILACCLGGIGRWYYRKRCNKNNNNESSSTDDKTSARDKKKKESDTITDKKKKKKSDTTTDKKKKKSGTKKKKKSKKAGASNEDRENSEIHQGGTSEESTEEDETTENYIDHLFEHPEVNSLRLVGGGNVVGVGGALGDDFSIADIDIESQSCSRSVSSRSLGSLQRGVNRSRSVGSMPSRGVDRSNSGLAMELKVLKDLHEQEILNDKEFEEAKSVVLRYASFKAKSLQYGAF